MAVSVLAEALVRWQHAAGPFWPYVCAAPFLMTGDGELLARQVWERAAERVAECGTGRGSERRSGGGSRGTAGLAARLLRLVSECQKNGMPRAAVFDAICHEAHLESLPENSTLLPRAAIPYMDEPWYC